MAKGDFVPMEDLPPELRTQLKPGSPAWQAYAQQLEQEKGLPAGSVTGA